VISVTLGPLSALRPDLTYSLSLHCFRAMRSVMSNSSENHPQSHTKNHEDEINT
jgi:hypothetical protein